MFLFIFFICILRCGSRSVGHGGGTLTSGEESSAEWRWARLDTDEEQGSEEWPVRSNELQMNPPVPLHPLTPENKTCVCDPMTFMRCLYVLSPSACLLFTSFSVQPLSK